MYEIKFKAGTNTFTYTSHTFETEEHVKTYFFNEYVPKYFNNDHIEVVSIKKII